MQSFILLPSACSLSVLHLSESQRHKGSRIWIHKSIQKNIKKFHVGLIGKILMILILFHNELGTPYTRYSDAMLCLRLNISILPWIQIVSIPSVPFDGSISSTKKILSFNQGQILLCKFSLCSYKVAIFRLQFRETSPRLPPDLTKRRKFKPLRYVHTKHLLCVDFGSHTVFMFTILGADRKNRGIWGREWV